MTLKFNRPNPKNATVSDIEKAIADITKWNWETCYTFGHIVIDDFNLSDGHILFCLEPSRIAETINQKIQDEFDHTDFDKLETWEWGTYENIITHMAEVISLLYWLLNVPENIRDMVNYK